MINDLVCQTDIKLGYTFSVLINVIVWPSILLLGRVREIVQRTPNFGITCTLLPISNIGIMCVCVSVRLSPLLNMCAEIVLIGGGGVSIFRSSAVWSK